MATQGRNGRIGPTIRDFGTFKVHGPDQPRVSIPKDAIREGFGADIGDEVKVELVQPDDGESYIELHPTSSQ